MPYGPVYGYWRPDDDGPPEDPTEGPLRDIKPLRPKSCTVPEYLDAAAFWTSAFGTGTPYHSLDADCIVGNLAHRSAAFAECVRALESAKGEPRPEVLDAAEARLEELK